ncbi:MAG: Tol-Pal system beta propeller repeat protein TolB [Fibrobacteres bacterium]|nr:Tol-Pal system beta propeller repeat protein TolB [Fibrobacterota bacterium]
MKRFVSAVFIAAVCLFAQEELYIESTADGAVKMNIAVMPLVVTAGKGSDAPSKVVASDLRFSGRFTVFEINNVDTLLFREKGITVYVSGSAAYQNGKAILSYELHDAYSMNLIVNKKYEVAESNIRRAAHLFSDEVVYRLFGEKGIASTRIVAVQKRGGAKEIVLLDYDGHNMTRLTNNNKLNLTPAWSPDNQAIVYTSYRQETPALYVSMIYTGKTDRLTKNSRLNYSPSWNGVEDVIAFASSQSGECQIYTIDRDGANQKQLTFRKSIESSPCFSPNGYEIAFTSDRTGNPNIYVMDNEGGNQRRVTFTGKYNDAPSWSPRGDKIAYMSLESSGFNIYTVDVDGSNPKQLTKDTRSNEHPSFSPDGRLIVFSSTRGGTSDLYIMNEDGSEQTKITVTGDLFSPEWSGYQ